jgi:hypothetical protein
VTTFVGWSLPTAKELFVEQLKMNTTSQHYHDNHNAAVHPKQVGRG